MNQSAILKASYEAVYNNLSDLAAETKLFAMSGGGALEHPKEGIHSHPIVCLGISDLSQLHIDKNGHTVEIDEMLFEVPAQIGYVLCVTVVSEYYSHLLETAGALIQYFKDNNIIRLEDYKWHEEPEGKIVIEPVVRNLEPYKEPQFHNTLPTITLKYRMEMGINSQKGTPFKRVEKQAITGNLINQ
jgi:hypothetical protein